LVYYQLKMFKHFSSQLLFSIAHPKTFNTRDEHRFNNENILKSFYKICIGSVEKINYKLNHIYFSSRRNCRSNLQYMLILYQKSILFLLSFYLSLTEKGTFFFLFSPSTSFLGTLSHNWRISEGRSCFIFFSRILWIFEFVYNRWFHRLSYQLYVLEMMILEKSYCSNNLCSFQCLLFLFFCFWNQEMKC
jgi:hypothetical protein